MHAIWSWKPFIFLIFLVPHSKGKLLEVSGHFKIKHLIMCNYLKGG